METAKASYSRPKILLVDDRQENLFSLQAAIEHLDIEIMTATSGLAALELIAENRFFLILLDVQMPEMDGFQTARRIKTSQDGEKPPVIFVTAINKEQQFISEGYEAGAVDYMFKPLDPDIIEGKVKVFLDLETKRQALISTVDILDSTRSELVRSNKELEEFAHLASHDLRSPLRAISSFGKILKEETAEILNENQHELLDLVLNAAGKMDTLVTGLLEYAKVKSKGESFKEVSMNEIMAEILILHGPRIKEANGEIQADDLPVILGDPTQIQQVLRNLLDNSLKFVREGIPPLIRVYQEFDQVEDGCCRIVIADNGIGFPAEKASQIFKPFKRLVGQSQYDGSGMGMAVVQKIIQHHQGKISAEGQLEEGALFKLTLPLFGSEMRAMGRDLQSTCVG